jgi:hypothetical protein
MKLEKVKNIVFKTKFYRHELHAKRNLGENRWESKSSKKNGRVCSVRVKETDIN